MEDTKNNKRSISLLARYALVGIVLMFAILAIVGGVYLNHAEDKLQATASIEAAQKIQHSTSSMRSILWQAEFSLTEYLISPSSEQQARTANYLRAIADTFEGLSSNGIQMLGSDPSTQTRFSDLKLQLKSAINKLGEDTDQLMKIRVDRELLFPAMPTIVNSLNPANDQFNTATNLVLGELDPKQHTDAFVLFEELKLLWTRMISEYRVFMAFRTGTFGTAEIGMPIYASNTELIHNEIMDKLEDVKPFRDHDDYGFQVSESYDEMLEAAKEWYDGYEVVVEIQQSPEWRMDVPLLQREVRPALESIHMYLVELDRLSETLYRSAVMRLDNNAARISRNLWLVAIMVLLVVVAGFMYFRRNVLAPIAQMSQALHAEARGEKLDLEISGSQATEMANLNYAFNNMREQVRSREEDLAFMAHHDQLSELPNRIMFRKQIKQLLQDSGSGKFAIIIIGLDRFKEINDTYGYKIGDQVLVEFANILRKHYQQAKSVARLAGDEFAVVIDNTDAAQARHIATNMHKLFSRVFHIENRSLRIGASIGIAVFPEHADNADALISRASIALHLAKQDHSIIAMYSRERDPDSRFRIKIIDMLRSALENDELKVEYQPQVSTRTGEVVGFEALTRARTILEQGVTTQQLIDIAEQTGLIHPLTDWLLASVLRQCNDWNTQYKDVQVGINLSTTSFHNPDLINVIQGGLSAWDIPASCLKLEITEGIMMSDPQRAERVLHELNDLGIKISIDDFGTGYSSLQYLGSLPVHELKIDRSFISAMAEGKKGQSIVQTVIDFARNLEMRVVAEGVEDEATYKRLEAMGCDVVQGFYISRSVPGEDVLDWISSGRWQAIS